MTRTRRWATTIACVLACLPVLLLGAMPAPGWRLDRLEELGRGAGWIGSPHGGTFTSKVRITGRVQQVLAPGTSSPIKVRFHNKTLKPVSLGRVRVKITSIYAPHADAAHPCTKQDFRIRQMNRRTLQIPAHRSTDLAKLRVPATRWPTIAMVNRPVNQDGCKAARLTLRFGAVKRG